jgi:hypothetical protein
MSLIQVLRASASASFRQISYYGDLLGLPDEALRDELRAWVNPLKEAHTLWSGQLCDRHLFRLVYGVGKKPLQDAHTLLFWAAV